MTDRWVTSATDWSIQHTSRLTRPHDDVRRGRFLKRLVTADHTHTWWFNISPFKNKSAGCRVSSHQAPSLWNSLPPEIREAWLLEKKNKSKLNIYLFTLLLNPQEFPSALIIAPLLASISSPLLPTGPGLERVELEGSLHVPGPPCSLYSVHFSVFQCVFPRDGRYLYLPLNTSIFKWLNYFDII